MHHGYRVFLEDGCCSLLRRENAARRSVDFVSRLYGFVGWRRSRRERIGRSVIVRLRWSILNIIRLVLVLGKARLVLQNGGLQVRLGNHHILRLDRANQLHFSQFLLDATNASLLVSPFSCDVQ